MRASWLDPLTMNRPLLALSLCLSSLALAQDPAVTLKKLELKVGEEANLGFLSTPICDDPKVAVLSADGEGKLKAVGEGKTFCSGATVMLLRQVYEVTVKAPEAQREQEAPSTPF